MLNITRLPDANEIFIEDCLFRASQFTASWGGGEERFDKSFFKVYRFAGEERLDLVVPSDPETWCLMHCLRGAAKLVETGYTLNKGHILLQQWSSLDNTAVVSSGDGEETLLSVLTVRHSTSGTLEAVYKRIINNIKNIAYQQRPGGIRLKSLLIGSPLERAVGYEFVEVSPGSSISPHQHPYSDAFVYVARGGGAFLVDNKRILVEEGCHGNVPRQCPHAVEAGPDGMDFISVQIPPIGSDQGYVFLKDHSVREEVKLI